VKREVVGEGSKFRKILVWAGKNDGEKEGGQKKGERKQFETGRLTKKKKGKPNERLHYIGKRGGLGCGRMSDEKAQTSIIHYMRPTEGKKGLRRSRTKNFH